jgi:hypothetical protein
VAGIGFGLLLVVVVAIVSVAGAVRRDQPARSGAQPSAVTVTAPGPAQPSPSSVRGGR